MLDRTGNQTETGVDRIDHMVKATVPGLISYSDEDFLHLFINLISHFFYLKCLFLNMLL